MDELRINVRRNLLDVIRVGDASVSYFGRCSRHNQSDAGNRWLLGAKLLRGRGYSHRGGAVLLGGIRRLIRQPRVRDSLLTGSGWQS